MARCDSYLADTEAKTNERPHGPSGANDHPGPGVCCSGDGVDGTEITAYACKRAAELKGKQTDDLRAAVASVVSV